MFDIKFRKYCIKLNRLYACKFVTSSKHTGLLMKFGINLPNSLFEFPKGCTHAN